MTIRASIFEIANAESPCSGMAPLKAAGPCRFLEWLRISKFEFLNVRHGLLPALLAAVFFAAPVSGEEIDRLLVAVNGTVIMEGDVDLAAKLNELIFYGKNALPRTRTEEINRLIDLELMRQELTNSSLTQEDESKVEERMQSLRDLHADQGGLSALLARLGLQESELRSYLRLESSILKFVDFRFRPFAVVSAEEIKAYYEGKLADQLKKAKVERPALSQVSARIEDILREDKINASMDQWIGGIRRNSRIEYFQESESKSDD
jgi:parvulin-like peptidyl-prolyl isomerase